MTWSYDVTVLATNQTMQVRSLVQDTDATDQQIQDEEIAFCLVQYPTTGMPYLAAAAVCDQIAFRYAREVNNSIGPLSESADQKFQHYTALAQNLRVLHATNGKGVVTGSLAGTVVAAPTLGGGGRTFLGSTPYTNPEGQ